MFPLQPQGPQVGFFGRSAELTRLVALADEVAAAGGRARAAQQSGPPGVGQSRLMSELRRVLRKRGEAPLEAVCRPTDHRPHGPLLDLLGAAAQLMSDLGRPAPAIERALNLVAGLGDGSRAADRTLHLFETVRRALATLGDARPVVVFVHDLHRADAAALAMWRYVLENLLADPAFDWTPHDAAELAGPTFRGLLVTSFRVDERTRPLVDVARASAAVEHLPLAGLDAEGVRAFLQSPAVVQRFLEASAGLPVALEQLVDALPSDHDDLWHRRLGAVRPEDAPLLDILAAYREPCTPEQLREFGRLDDDPRAALGRLVEAQVLTRSLERGVLRFRFVRTGARKAWYGRMDAARRRDVHQRIAERLAAGFDAEPEAIADHLLAGGATAEAVPYALAAAERMQLALADGRAADLLERVVDAAEDGLRADLLERLSALYAGSGRLTDALRTLAALTEQFPDRAGPALEARRANLMLRAGEPADARRVAEAALAGMNDEALARRLTAAAAEAAYREGDLAAALAHCTPVPEPPGGAAGLALRNTRGKIHLAREELDEAHALFAGNLAAAEALGDEGHQARALINLGVVGLQRGEPERALERFDAARALTERTGDLRLLALSVENLAVLHHRRQDFSRALAYYHESTAAFRKLGHRAQLATTALNLADLYLTVGDVERARRLGDIAGEHIRRGRLRYLEPQALMLDGDVARHEGDVQRAADRYAAAIRLTEQGGGNNQRMGSLLWAQAELLLETGEGDAIEPLLDQAQALPTGQSDALTARLRMTRGTLHTRCEALETAKVELEAAVAAAEEAGDREVWWQALARLAEVHWAENDRAETLQALAGAVDVIERVAADLPASLRATYIAAAPRRGVGGSRARGRAGHAAPGPLSAPSPPERKDRLDRQSGPFRHQWLERYAEIIGRAPALHPVFNSLDRVSGSDSMVLIRGESGTGKELVAGALHRHSPRANGPFVKVNCAAFVETLLLSELFGHEKGAFTGAVSSKKGRFELADRGTLFLDEIGDISPNTQVALLRVLQEGTFERVGGQDTIKVDVRVICATHRNLEQMVRDGAFRADLYYRLRGVIIEVPPLRARREDIPLLVDHFLQRRPNATARPLRFTRAALASLVQHDWPGNVRELENVVRSVALFTDGDAIGLTELAELGDIFRPPDQDALLLLSDILTDQAAADAAPPPEERPPDEAPDAPSAPAGPEIDGASLYTGDLLERMLDEEGSLTDLKKRIEFEAIARALRRSGGNITHAAESLGMKRPRLSQIIHATPALGEIKREVSGS